MNALETNGQPLFIKLNTGTTDEFINCAYVVSVRFEHEASEHKEYSMTLHLTNGQYRTVRGESARRLKRALEHLGSLIFIEPEEEPLLVGQAT